jgi:excisionase family DNA binding protein
VVITATEEFLSPDVVGERLGVSVYTVRRWVKTGQLRAFKPGKEYRIREADLEHFLRAREVKGPDPAAWGAQEDRADPSVERIPAPGGRAHERAAHDEVEVSDEIRARIEEVLRIAQALQAREISEEQANKRLEQLFAA